MRWPGSRRTHVGALVALALAVWCTATGWSQQPPEAACEARPGAPRLDHAILVVGNLDSARALFEPLGFRLKPGRLHPDNLLNAHIRLRSGSELELMSLAGPPGDANARDNADLLAHGAGGAYAALVPPGLEAVARAADRAGLRYRRTSSGTWRCLSFPPPSDAGAVFFGTAWAMASDPDTVLDHPNGAVTLEQAWVEAGPAAGRRLPSPAWTAARIPAPGAVLNQVLAGFWLGLAPLNPRAP